jgi:hypothetical protein
MVPTIEADEEVKDLAILRTTSPRLDDEATAVRVAASEVTVR